MIAWTLLFYTLELFKWLIIVRAIMSWFVSPHSNNPLVQIVRRLTDPILRPLSQVVPTLGGVDITPLVAFFAILLLQQVILGVV